MFYCNVSNDFTVIATAIAAFRAFVKANLKYEKRIYHTRRLHCSIKDTVDSNLL